MLRRRLLRWFDEHARDYPWRRTSNWFHLLMAEMMLRRTRADQVVPVYERFCRRYERPSSTRRLDAEKLEVMLAPLGLRWRARHLVETLRYVRHSFAQHAPGVEDDLTRIPGVGPYSEAMLRNRLFGEPRAAVDANVVRILQRWTGSPVDVEARRHKEIWKLADRFVRHKRSADLNLALLDFGSLVCRPVGPRCGVCPLHDWCPTGTNTIPHRSGKGAAGRGRRKET